ncbi:MAG: sulfatase [Planctomycetaceae bacterium]|nr:sulfatase [Planctomycetaceae bacterium]
MFFAGSDKKRLCHLFNQHSACALSARLSLLMFVMFSGAVSFAASPVIPADQPNSVQPNIVLIIADDCTYRDLEVYGGQARTPNLVKLAEQGMQFDRCFQAAPMCSPTRHCLYSGLYPVKSGAYPNHTMAHDWVQSIATYLQPAGYRTFLSGKTHIGPRAVFPFEYSGQGNNPDLDAIDAVLGDCSAQETPFLLIAASNEPHTPWNKGDASAYPPSSLKLHPILVDSPDTREAYSRYLAEITYFDDQVGRILALLEKHRQVQNTMVIVLSEQGYSFPFAKWTCYDTGLQSGCLVRWPGRIKPGSRSDAMVEYVDIVPTVLEAIGLDRPDVLDGRSFLPVLTGNASTHKKYVFGLQTSRGINAGPEHYGIRSVRSERYRLIRNLTPETTFVNAATNDPTFRTWRSLAADGDAQAASLVHDYQHRPAWELYDCVSDPWNRSNLIDDPSLVEIRRELTDQLDRWMQQQGDNGQETEMLALTRMPRHTEATEKPPASPKKKKGKKKAR